jgi:transposase
MERADMAGSQKKWVEEGRAILFVDECGFYLLPSVVRTWSPVGERPILREWVSRDHLSAICGISEGGELHWLQQEVAFDGEGVVGFLKQLLAHVGGEAKLGIVWDAAPIHRAKSIKQFLADGGAQRIELVMLPGYSPDLNPAEGVWSYLKGVLLANVICHDLSQLWCLLADAVERLRRNPNIIKGCFKQPGCY